MIVMIFEFTVVPERYEEYLCEAAQLREQLDKIDGFVSVERFESKATPGKFVAIGYFETEESVTQWRTLPEHRRVQALGREKWFSDYRLVMATAIRDYTGTQRDEAPEDSRRFHDTAPADHLNRKPV